MLPGGLPILNAYAIVQHPAPGTGTSDATGNAIGPAWASAPTQGNLLTMALTFRGNATTGDNTTQGWIKGPTITNGTTCQTEIWYRVAGVGESTTGPQMQISVSTLFVIDMAEVNGFTGTPTLDRTGTAIGTAVATLATAVSATTTAASEFVFGACGNAEGNTAGITFSASTAGGGATLGADIDTTNPPKNGEGLRDTWATSGTSGTSPSITFNLSASTATKLAACIASFKGVVAAAVTVLPNTRAMDQSREFMLLYRRPRQLSLVPDQPSLMVTSLRKRVLALVRRGKSFEPPWTQLIAPVNPAFVEFWRKRLAWPRSWQKRGRSVGPPWGQAVVPPPGFVTWPVRRPRLRELIRRRTTGWIISGVADPISTSARRRPVAWLRKSRPIDISWASVVAVVNPAFTGWWRRRFINRTYTRRTKSIDPPWGQAVAAPNPSFTDWARRRLQAQARVFLRRGKNIGPPWGQAAAVQAPPFIDWWKRRSRPVVLTRRARLWSAPEAAVFVATVRQKLYIRAITRRVGRVQSFSDQSMISSPIRRRAGAPVRRRGKFSEPSWIQVALVNPAFADWWRRRLGTWAAGGVFIWRLRSFLPPWAGGLVIADNVGAFDSPVFTVGAVDLPVYSTGAVDSAVPMVGAQDTIP